LLELPNRSQSELGSENKESVRSAKLEIITIDFILIY
jgi:hypothetical protein